MSTDMLQVKMREIVLRLGVPEATKRLQLDRESILRICGGLPVRRGTVFMAERAIELLGESDRSRKGRKT